MHDPARCKLAFFLAGLALWWTAETLFASRPWRAPRSRRLAVHLAVAAFNSVFLRLTVVLPLMAFIERVHARGGGLLGLLGLQGPAAVVLTVAAFDLYDYWWHRFNHEVPFLWRFHRAHHLDDHVDVTTALRFHIGELLLSCGAKAGFVLLWGPSVLGFILSEVCITAAAHFHHANIDFPDLWERRLRPLIMTPRVHAGHHTVTLRSRDANYATILSCWDRLFGSFQEPDRAELRELGLPGAREGTLSLKAILTAPIR
jgi:sterol desaturase/sphingolipid hydroxylase (fatty acid hydroxylase superfamily)